MRSARVGASRAGRRAESAGPRKLGLVDARRDSHGRDLPLRMARHDRRVHGRLHASKALRPLSRNEPARRRAPLSTAAGRRRAPEEPTHHGGLGARRVARLRVLRQRGGDHSERSTTAESHRAPRGLRRGRIHRAAAALSHGGLGGVLACGAPGHGARKARVRFGFGYRASRSIAFELLFVRDWTRSTLSDAFAKDTQAIDLRVRAFF